MMEKTFNTGSFVTLLPRYSPKMFCGRMTRGGYGRLQYGTVYEVRKITKQGHLMVDTPWGKMFYSKKLFKNVSNENKL